MSIDQTDLVDFVGIERDTGKVVLTITDHLDWATRPEQHLQLLQEKINIYLSFVESGELLAAYPEAEGRAVEIGIFAKYPLSEEAHEFIRQARLIVEEAGLGLRHQLLRHD